MRTYPNGNDPKSMMSLEVVRNIEMKTKKLYIFKTLYLCAAAETESCCK